MYLVKRTLGRLGRRQSLKILGIVKLAIPFFMYLYLLVSNKSCYLVILVFYIQFILKFHQFVILSCHSEQSEESIFICIHNHILFLVSYFKYIICFSRYFAYGSVWQSCSCVWNYYISTSNIYIIIIFYYYSLII